MVSIEARPTKRTKVVVIMGVSMIQVTLSLEEKGAVSVANLIISQPCVEADNSEVPIQPKRSKLLTKKSTRRRIPTKCMLFTMSLE